MEGFINSELINSSLEHINLSFIDEPLLSITYAEPVSKTYINKSVISKNEQSYDDNIISLGDLLPAKDFIIKNNNQSFVTTMPEFFQSMQFITSQNQDVNKPTNCNQTLFISIIPENQNTPTSENIIKFPQDTSIEVITDMTLSKSNEILTDHSNRQCILLSKKKTRLEEELLYKINVPLCSSIAEKTNDCSSGVIKLMNTIVMNSFKTKDHFICDLCLQEFDKWLQYKQHRLEHFSDEPLKGYKTLCNNNREPSSPKKHSSIRDDETVNGCQNEEIHFRSQKVYRKTLTNSSGHKMHKKEHNLKSISSVKKHKTINIAVKTPTKLLVTAVKKFKCNSCEWSFHKLSLLKRHLRTHTGEKPFKCNLCSKYFTQKNSLSRHQLRHEGLLPFKCDYCSLKFSQKVHLLNHVRRCHAVIKEPTRIHKCNKCSCVYNSVNALTKHFNMHHNVKNRRLKECKKKSLLKSDQSDMTNSIIKDPSEVEKWLNTFCEDLQNSDNKSLIVNSRTKLGQLEDSLNANGNEFKNEFKSIIREKNAESDEIIYEDLQIENSPFSFLNGSEITCTATNQRFQPELKKMFNEKKQDVGNDCKYEADISLDNTNPSSKLQNKNTNGLTEACNNAEPMMLYMPNITISLEKEKKMEKYLKLKKCQFCSKVFKKNADLERHERIHTGCKPFKCKMKRAVCSKCNGLFATTSSLKVHMRQHTGEKPFKCPMCGDTFRTSGHMHTHILIHERKKNLKCL
ncbi:zinc finger protein 91-like isoform X2 [Adelges cooleyi]|uniref:zinc finger protein 91-like isoform X2 n=1 Tax=Adelges cooleyi TaxID=133065 RepID=UPI002180315D|nr:zinc finger protein 91-like isoform X2 [Adelges cooleyi]